MSPSANHAPLIGILGGGQLGRMLVLAGLPLGFRFRVLDPDPGAPAGQVADQIVGRYDDGEALDRLANGVEVITYEFENVPMDAATYLATRAPVRPAPAALEKAQDRLHEKSLFQSLGIPTPAFARVDSAADVRPALDAVGLPAVLKTRRLGYDGKGQCVVHTAAELDAAYSKLGSRPLILEQFIPFDDELSVVAVRDQSGASVCYPLSQNRHADGMLRQSIPSIVPHPCQASAEAYARAILEHFDYVGVMALELFLWNDRLLANEMAPRVHNSGHWTIEGAVTSQFENHLRAVAGLPLGAAAARGPVAMLNLIGELPNAAQILSHPGTHLHLYGKAARPGRKLGHITITAESESALRSTLSGVQELISAA